MENVIHTFGGMYDADMNVELYLLAEKEITKAQYECVKENLGVYGPGRQVILRGDGKYYLKADEEASVAEERIKAELKEMDVEYPS